MKRLWKKISSALKISYLILRHGITGAEKIMREDYEKSKREFIDKYQKERGLK